ncbi:MAG: pyridoxal phosphate-dependent aminotransferase [Acidobacteriia bacterium]|nr:pyridoxal phosphate-dependent aminotransferase [Terriglobia bacterium]
MDSTEAMSIKYNTMVYELKQRGKHVLVMSLGEAYFDIPLFPMDELPQAEVHHYSHSRGLLALRRKLAQYFHAEYAVDFDPDEEVIITAGSKAAIHMTFMSILNPGDEVIYSEPAWVSYPEQIRLCYATPVGVRYQKSVYEFEEFITPKTKAIVINNPHNPSGQVLSRKELEHILDLARKHNLWVLSDEAYSDFVWGEEFISLARLDPNKEHAIVFNSMSKNYGISGWRVGYVIANKAVISNVLKVNQHLITCPATILQHYLARHFHQLLEITKPQIQAVLCKRKQVAAYMDQIGLSYLPGSSTFYLFASIAPSRLSSEEFCTRLLQDEYVSIVPGVGYGESCDAFVRISVGAASLEENQLGLRKIKELIEKTS